MDRFKALYVLPVNGKKRIAGFPIIPEDMEAAR